MKNKKFPYEKPEMSVIKFTVEDILTASGGIWDREPAELEEIFD